MGLAEWITSINSYVGIIGIIVGLIGIVVGIIGRKSLSVATKLKNNIKNVDNSTIHQAQSIVVNNGMDSYAVIHLAKEATQEELATIFNQVQEEIQKRLDSEPRIFTSADEPQNPKAGDVWFKPVQ